MRHPLTRSTVVAATTALVLSLLSPTSALADDNRPPDRPDTATLTARGKACSTDKNAPALIGSTAPLLRGTFRDPDSEAGAQRIKAEFEWSLDGADQPLGTAESAHTWHHPGRDPQPLSVTARDLPERTRISYRARGHDDQVPGEWSEWCWIEVDTDGPKEPPQVTSDDYPQDGGFHGGPGQASEFTFADHGTPDAVAYEYNLGLEPLCDTRVDLDEPGDSATVLITPRGAGPQWLYARSVDAYGNASPCESVYEVLVAPLADPVAYFPLNEGEGTSASDLLEQDRTAAGTGDVGWTRGRVGERRGGGYRLEGAAVDTADGHLRTEAAVVDTAAAFTVSAWVRLDGTGSDAVAVSQDGEHLSGFQLGYDASEEAWIFQQAPQDAPGTGFDHRVASTAPVQAGVWTQLIGQYDPAAGEMALYVDGVRQGGADRGPSWSAEGPFVIGGGQEQGAFARGWPGAVDDVKVWSRLLIDEDTHLTWSDRSEVWETANQPLAPEGSWRLEESAGAAATDSSDHGLDATLHGDPATVWNGALNDWLFTPAVLLDGAEQEHLRTDGAALRTDRSFTASAWVRLDDGTADAVALSQSGEHTSGFALGYDAELGGWVFETAVEDVRGGEEVHRVTSTAGALVGEWVHLVGTYDHTDGTLTLYVDGSRAGTAASEGAWHAEGDVVIGAAGHADGVDRSWTGALGSVHVFQGVALKDDLTRLHLGYLP